jgi:hypothetical protein
MALNQLRLDLEEIGMIFNQPEDKQIVSQNLKQCENLLKLIKFPVEIF